MVTMAMSSSFTQLTISKHPREESREYLEIFRPYENNYIIIIICLICGSKGPDTEVPG